MAMETVTQAGVHKAIQRLANVHGILTVAVAVLDEQVAGSPLWEVSEAMHGAIELVSESYCTLNEGRVSFTVEEAGHGN